MVEPGIAVPRKHEILWRLANLFPVVSALMDTRHAAIGAKNKRHEAIQKVVIGQYQRQRLNARPEQADMLALALENSHACAV